MDSPSPLFASFSFGILLNAAVGAFFLTLKGHGSAIFRDGQRLVLASFLLSAGLWAQVGFVATTVPVVASIGCSIAAILATVFDQLARFSIEQFLLWSVNAGSPPGIGQLIPQAILMVRFALGFVFVGFTRNQRQGVCAPISSVEAVAVATMSLDFVIAVMLAVKAFTGGVVDNARASPDSARPSAARSKATVVMLAGFTIWTATSVPLFLGNPAQDLALRTALPATGLTVLILIVTSSMDALSSDPKKRHSRQPESPTRRLDTRDISTSGTDVYPPSHYEDVKGDEVRVYVQNRGGPGPMMAPTSQEIMFNNAAMGFGGMPAGSALAPPMRAATEPVRQASRRGVQLKGKNPFDANGKLMISNPILEAESEQNPLNKIPTMDLRAAVEMDRERRENALQALQRESALIATRPAPQPPASVSSQEDSMKRAMSLRRKTAASIKSETVIQETLEPMPTIAATSSAQLSPGMEELRRRSPRQAPDLPRSDSVKSNMRTPTRLIDQSSPESPPQAEQMTGLTAPPPKAPAKDEPPKVIGAPTVQDRANMAPAATQFQSAFYVPIRPSRQRPDSLPKATEPEAPKTGLQRRPTIGLPGNPRAKAMTPAATLAAEAGAQRQQTVMFINNITYNDPAMVKNIINEAKGINTDDVEFSLKKTNSVVNRPRPIPRKSEEDRVIFPSEPSPNHLKHRRSRSGGSLVSKKSILQSTPGSPTQLPPLPPPPKSAGGFVRPQPNNTKSMTFDEKMKLFYAANGEAVPAIPPVPSNFAENDDDDDRKSRTTHRTTKSSFQTESILDVDIDEIIQRPTQSQAEEEPEADIDDYWMGGGDEVTLHNNRPSINTKRASSPILPPPRNSAWTENSDMKSMTDVATTNWGSVHSPVAAVNMQRARGIITMNRIRESSDDPIPPMPVRETLKIHSATFGEETDDRRETMTIMLDSSVTVAQAVPTQEEVVEQETQETDEEEATLPRTVFSGWHRRIGDDCPTFSERKEKMRSRMPPPIPLLLNAPSTRNPVIVKAAEPSPLESPDHALRVIQDQLKRMDQPNRDSVESQGTRRIALLENLEKEMDQQEGHWHDMQHGMRDSLSTMRTTPTIDSRPQSMASRIDSRPQSMASRHKSVAPALGPEAARPVVGNVLAERRAAKRETIRSSIASSKSSMTWQQRLAAAEEELEDFNPELLATRTPNFLALAQMGSPTPPDTDDAIDREAAFESLNAAIKAQAESVEIHTAHFEPQAAAPKSLWTPPSQETPAESLLWSHTPAKHADVQTVQVGTSARTTPRKDSEPLTVESRQLWQQSRNATKRNSIGLWQPRYVQPQSAQRPASYQTPATQPQVQKPARPVTVRPPRRNRRMTLLPDIIEDPQPLPDNRGTLGIFQFPWGEKSDVPVVQPRQSVFAMPGTMTSGALAARSRMVEATEYESSFFDDYEDEYEFDDMEDSDVEEEETSGDEFDESTLWEIASLLKSDSVPSKASLLPPRQTPAADSVLGEYMDDSDLEGRDDARESIIVGLDGIIEEEEPIIPDLMLANRRPKQLWTPALSTKEKRRNHGLGLPNPDANVWRSYDSVSETIRSQPRQSEIVPIESDKLWQPAAQAEKKFVPTAAKVSKPVARSTSMWSAANKTKAKGEHGKGVAQPDAATWSRYDTVKETARSPPRRSEEPLAISSRSLWQSAGRKEKSTIALWTAPTAVVKKAGSHGKGVAQPDAATWSRYDTIRETARSKPRQAEPAVIQTNALWIDSPPASPKSVTDWSRIGTTTTTPTKKNILREQTNHMTSAFWTPSASPTKSRGNHGKGLAQPVDWHRYNATHETARAKPRQAEPAVIESSALWIDSPPESPKSQRDWIAVGAAQRQPRSPVSMPTQRSQSPDVMHWQPHSRSSSKDSKRSFKSDNWPLWPLWAPPQAPQQFVLETNGGLYQRRPSVPDTRYTDEEPAALDMERKPRAPELLPLDKLSSTQLWTASAANARERNWIKTKASRQPATMADWKLALYRAVNASYPPEWQPRMYAASSDWAAALKEAVDASSHRDVPRRVVDRSHRQVSPTDWDAALDEAIMLSQPQQVDNQGFGAAGDDDIMAQIRALEEERMFAEQAMGRSFDFEPQQQQQHQVMTDLLVPQVPPMQSEYVDNNYWQPQPQDMFVAPPPVNTGLPSAFVGPDGQIYSYVADPEESSAASPQTPGGRVMLRY